jgi:hypothetical protein
MLLRILLVLTVSAAALSAQSSSATVSGVVRDASGASITGSDVKVISRTTGLQRTSQSAADGTFVVPLLDPGAYDVSVAKSGFKTYQQSQLTLTINQVARIDVTLEVGGVSDKIEVLASTNSLDTETSSLGNIISNSQITEMPINGRNVMSLLQLSAAVTPQAGINAGFNEGTGFLVSNVSISGGRGSMNQILFDGANNAAPTRQEVAVTPSVDAVAEVKIYTTGTPAEFGRTTGGAISMISKSGTNDLHGTLFEFLRNDKLDARNAFALSRPPFRFNQFGGSLGGPILVPKIYDGRNKSFFFFNYEGSRFINYTNRLFTVPTAIERTGDFSRTAIANGTVLGVYDPVSTRANPAGSGFVRTQFPGNVIPASRFDRISAAIMRDVPLGNTQPTNTVTNINNYFEQIRRQTSNDQYIGRFDHNIGSAHRLSYRLAYNFNGITPDSQFGNYLTQGEANDIFSRNYSQQVASYTWLVNPRMFLDFRGGYVRTVINRRPPTFGGADMDRLNYPSILPRVQFPSHQITDFTELGGGQIVDGGVHTITFNQSTTQIVGRHTLKYGGEIWRLRNNRFQQGGLSGTFNFTRALTNDPQRPQLTGYGTATFLLGAVNAGSLVTATKLYERGWYGAMFIQDDWRLSSRLTLNLGLRWDLETNPVDRFNQRSAFNFTRTNPITNQPGVLEFAGVDYQGSNVPTDRNNFGPRFGFAYTLDSSARTVVRGSYGLMYQGIFETFESNLGWSATTPFNDPSLGPVPTFYLSQGPRAIIQPPGNSLGPRSFLGLGVLGRDPSDRVGYTQQWSLNVQRALPGGWVVETGYVGTKGNRIGLGSQGVNVNALDPRFLSLGFALQDQIPNPLAPLGIFGATVSRQQTLLPYPAYQGVTRRAPAWGNSIYHGLQINSRKAFSKGLSAQLSYAFGKTIDDTVPSLSAGFAGFNTGDPGYQTFYDRRAERSISPTDVSQRFVANWLYSLPVGKGQRLALKGPLDWVLGGWQISGILTAQTGVPLVVRGANNNAANRPNSTGRSAELPSDQRTVTRWFDTTAFSGPPLFTFGNVGRVLPDVRAPGLLQIDAGLQKFFPIGEKARLQLRGEAFNLTNKVNLGAPDTGFLSTAFGNINSAGASRALQVGAKITF